MQRRAGCLEIIVSGGGGGGGCSNSGRRKEAGRKNTDANRLCDLEQQWRALSPGQTSEDLT